jgi:TonB family protein
MLFFVWLAAAQADATHDALDAIVESSRQLTPAKQLQRTAPRYPKQELRNGKQAWVHVAYCIDESGSPQNVTVLDSVGSSKFDRAAIDSVKRWKFEPALVNGEPSWQSRNQTLITFAIEQGNTGASKKFTREFRKISRLIDEEKLPEADQLFWRVYEGFDLSLYELAKLWAQRVRYEGKLGDMYKLDMALHRATASDGEWIDDASYTRLLKLRTQVEINLGQYHAARHAFSKLVKMAGEDAEEVLELQPTMEKLREMIDSDNILKINAEVRRRGECNSCDNSWNFTPVRSDFAFDNVTGNLESIEMRCDHKRFESDVSDLVEWHIPKDWGTCNVRVYGEPGATFDVLMLPAG